MKYCGLSLDDGMRPTKTVFLPMLAGVTPPDMDMVHEWLS